MPVKQSYLIYLQGYKVMNLPDIFHALTLAPREQCEYMHKFGGAWVDSVFVLCRELWYFRSNCVLILISSVSQN